MRKRKFISFMLAGSLAVLQMPANAAALPEIPKTAVTAAGVGTGINGEDVVVEVTADENTIYRVEVTEHNETPDIGSVAVEMLPSDIIEKQTLNIDALTGATVTSTAILDAAAMALKSAGFDPSSYTGNTSSKSDTETEAAEDIHLDTDIVIVGAGGAGMTAAITAADEGAKVVLIESQPMVGGNSVRSTGGMNAAKTKFQDSNDFSESQGVEATLENAAAYADNEVITQLAAAVKEQWEAYQADPEGYFDSVELFELDTLIGGKGINDPELVFTLVENTEDSVNWLDSIGASLSSVSQFGGASVKRIHRPVDENGSTISVGSYLVPILHSNIEQRENITLMLNTTAKQLLTSDEGSVTGIYAKTAEGASVTITAKSVILATGGFGANLEMVTKLNPDLEGFMTTNAPGILGEGLTMAQDIGAATVDLNQIQIHPTVQYDTAALITEGLRGDGAILVNTEGKRFVNEVETRDKVSAAEIAQPDSFSYLIIDQKMADASAVIRGYIDKGYTVSGDTYESLAAQIGVPEDVFAETMNTWNGYVTDGNDPEFNRTSFASALDTPPYTAIKVTAGIHHTMGGLKINSDAQVLTSTGDAIEGLYAAGEVVGGVHGANRLGGNAVADFIVYGRIAGKNAAAFVN